MQARWVIASVVVLLLAGTGFAVKAFESAGTDLPPREMAAEDGVATANAQAAAWRSDAKLVSVTGIEGRFPQGLLDPPFAWDASADPNPGNGLAIVWTYVYRAADEEKSFFVSVDGDGDVRYAQALYAPWGPFGFGSGRLPIDAGFLPSATAMQAALTDERVASFAAKHPVHATLLTLMGSDDGSRWSIARTTDTMFGVAAMISPMGDLLEVHAWPEPPKPCPEEADVATDANTSSGSSTATASEPSEDYPAYRCGMPPCHDCPPCDCDPCRDCWTPPAPPNHSARHAGSLGLGEQFDTGIPVRSIDHAPVIRVDVAIDGLPLVGEARVTLYDSMRVMVAQATTKDTVTLEASDLLEWGDYYVTVAPTYQAAGLRYDVDISVTYGEYAPRSSYYGFYDYFYGGFYPLGDTERIHEVDVPEGVYELVARYNVWNWGAFENYELTVLSPSGNVVAHQEGAGTLRIDHVEKGTYTFIASVKYPVVFAHHYGLEVMGRMSWENLHAEPMHAHAVDEGHHH